MEATPASAATFGRYALLGTLGRGGMGVVMHARDPRLDREVALKLLRGSAQASERQRRRFLREARAVAKLDHPNIVDIYDIGEHAGVLYFTMQLVRGRTLRELIREGPLPPERALPIAAALGRALHHAHSHGLIHRDVKPGNVLMDGDTPILTDFGLVKRLEGESVHLTREAAVMGTPAYMSPEQALGELDEVGPLSDLYALGVVLYEMLTGIQPFRAPTPQQSMRRVVSHSPMPLQDPVLDRICRQAMARYPQDRYPSTAAFAEDLERYLAGRHVEATGLSLRRRLALAAEDHRSALIGAGVASLAVLVLLVTAVAVNAGLQRRALQQREAVAMERLTVMEDRVARLTDEGRLEEAQATFAAFVNFDEHRDTRARARAWLHRGSRLDDPVAANAALATAYALAAHPDDQAAALLALAERFREAQSWDRLRAVVHTLGATPEEQDTGQMRTWQRDLALVQRDTQVALGFGQGTEEAALLDALNHATRTGHTADGLLRLDWDRDGTDDLTLWDTVSGILTPLRPAPGPALAPRSAPIRLTEDRLRAPRPLHTTGPWPQVILSRGNICSQVEVGPSGPQVLAEHPCTYTETSTQADLDGDGVSEDYISSYRTLFRVDPRADAPALLVDAWPDAEGLRSTVRDVQAIDVDGDGRDELLMALAEWGAYDVRLLKADADGRLRLQSRVRLGEVFRVRTYRDDDVLRVVALQIHDPDDPLNRRVFRDDAPQGAPAGLHLLRVEDGALVHEGYIPMPYAPLQLRGRPSSWIHLPAPALHIGDLDGDGRVELILGRGLTWTFIYRQRDDGGWTLLPLDGLIPLGVEDLDGDGDDELLVSTADDEHAVWVLGAGDRGLPRLEAVAAQPQAPPSGLDPAIEASWRRAEALVAMGMPEVAAEQLARLAELTETPALALLRAAHILEDSGATSEARRRYRAATSEPTLAAEAWEGVGRTAMAERRLEEALAATQERLALPRPPPELAEQAARLSLWLQAPTLTLDFAEGPDPALRISTPLDASWSAQAGGLRVRKSDADVLGRVPLRWAGDYARISMTLTPEQVSWGTGWTLRIQNLDGERYEQRVGLDYIGGSGLYNFMLSCGGHPGFILQQDLRGTPITVTFEMSVDPPEASCSILQGDVQLGRKVYALPGLAPGEREVDLTLGGHPVPGPLDGTLHRIELAGFELRDEPPSVIEQANAALMRGASEEALSLVQATPSDPAEDALIRALASAALGRPGDAEAALREGLQASPDLGGGLTALMLLRLDQLEGPLRGALGDRYPLAFAEAWGSALYAHPDEPWTLAPLTQHLEGLAEEAASTRWTEAEQATLIDLLSRRGGAWRRLGRVARAERDLERARALAEQQLARTRDADVRAELDATLTFISRELAIARLERGDAEGALALLLEGLTYAPAPEIYADILAATVDLDRLHETPGWQAIEDARNP
ncbi:MAG: serine/threonine protein kinase [Alphaproteobacteria bacterium]|nr:serine/threonine protein kinase [Alphaproteobacteria bacterium]